MEHDDRERRDSPDPAEPQPPSDAQPTPETDAARSPETAEPAEAAQPPTDETRPWPTEPPEPGGAGETWPTAPPAWETDAPEAWPTEPPPRTDATVDDATPSADAVAAPHEPPPSDVEAYGAGPAEGTEGVTPSAVGGGAAAHTVPDSGSATGESTLCPRCGTENRPGLAFCRNCGQRLVAAGMTPTVQRPATPEGTQACPRCGTHNRAGVAFCQNCGANLRAAAAGYVPPAVAAAPREAEARPTRRTAVLGPVVLLIGVMGIVTAYLLPFKYGAGSLYDRALGPGGYGGAFWSGYQDVGGALADQAYFGLAGPAPAVAVLLVILAIAGLVRGAPGVLQRIGLVVTLLWSVGMIVLFAVVELAGNWDGDLITLLRALTPAGIILFLASLIVLIGTLTRFARS